MNYEIMGTAWKLPIIDDIFNDQFVTELEQNIIINIYYSTQYTPIANRIKILLTF